MNVNISVEPNVDMEGGGGGRQKPGFFSSVVF